jgi:4'-phosphopantetheinyl transferase
MGGAGATQYDVADISNRTTAPVTIRASEILVWLMEVDAPAPALLAHWRGPLDAEERARAARFYFDPDRAIYIAAHWLLRTALAEAGGLPAAGWRFVNGCHGKPRIDPALGRPELSFNLSHTKGLVACAVATDLDIGIDVELMAPRHAGLDIAERYFSANEVALLRATDEPQQQVQAFFRFWTLKEALIKATGEGLQRPLDSFSFAFDPTRVAFHPDDPDEALRWTFWEQPTARHALALAIWRPSPLPLRLSLSQVRIHEETTTVIERAPPQILGEA